MSVKASRPVRKVWVASPDFNGGVAQDVPFIQNDGIVSFTLPTVEYWTMAVLEEREDNIYITGEAVKAADKEAYDLTSAITMVPSDNGKVFKASVYLKGGEPFKFVNDVDWGSCQSYNAEYSDYEFNDQINTANLIFADSDDYKFKVKESGNYDITLYLEKGTVEVERSAYQAAALDRYPALFLIGDHVSWMLSKATPLTATEADNPFVISASVQLSKGNSFKFATRRVNNDWSQPMFVMGNNAEDMILWDHADATDKKWTAPEDGTYTVTVNRLAHKVSVTDPTTGISPVVVSKGGKAEYFTLSGVKASKPLRGVYLKRVNGKSTKVLSHSPAFLHVEHTGF